MTKANIGNPSHLCAKILSAASCFVWVLLIVLRFSTLCTISLITSYLFLSETSTAILSVIKEQAQIVTDILVKNHIKGILNFTTYKLETPDDVAVVDVNISANLQELNFWKDMLKNKGE